MAKRNSQTSLDADFDDIEEKEPPRKKPEPPTKGSTEVKVVISDTVEVDEDGDIKIPGRRPFNPPCVFCSTKDKVVFTKVTSTRGPVFYVKCESCGWTPSQSYSRPYKTHREIYQESVAARPDMEK